MTERQSNIWHIPEGWEVKKLKQCFKFKNGKFFSNELREKTDCEYRYPVYGGNGIIGYCNEHLLDKETIIIGRVGEYCGNVFKTQDKSWVTDNAMLVSDVLLKDFDINFWTVMLNSLHFNHYSDSTGQPKITQGSIGAISVIYPSRIIEQSAIAAILSKVDESIASVQASISAAERLKKSLMQNLLTGRMKPDGTLRKDDEFYVDEKFGKVPKGWEVKKVKDLSIQVTDGEHQTPERSETGYYLLSARNIKNGQLSLDDVDYISEKELKRIQRRCNPQGGDILISCSGTIGNVCIVPDGFVGGMVRSAALVKLNKEKIESQFAELMFQSHFLQNQMKVSVASSVQGNIFQGAIKNLRMFYPQNKQERLEIVNKISQFNKTILDRVNKITSLERLKKSLMQNLLTGRVRVK